VHGIGSHDELCNRNVAPQITTAHFSQSTGGRDSDLCRDTGFLVLGCISVYLYARVIGFMRPKTRFSLDFGTACCWFDSSRVQIISGPKVIAGSFAYEHWSQRPKIKLVIGGFADEDISHSSEPNRFSRQIDLQGRHSLGLSRESTVGKTRDMADRIDMVAEIS
jgi:hypothetical protein